MFAGENTLFPSYLPLERARCACLMFEHVPFIYQYAPAHIRVLRGPAVVAATPEERGAGTRRFGSLFGLSVEPALCASNNSIMPAGSSIRLRRALPAFFTGRGVGFGQRRLYGDHGGRWRPLPPQGLYLRYLVGHSRHAPDCWHVPENARDVCFFTYHGGVA